MYTNCLFLSVNNSTTLLVFTAALFQANAEDFFGVTRKSFNWNTMPKYVIGRPAYDNCLVTQAVKDSQMDTIDGSLSIHAVHQSGSDGNFAGHKRRPDTTWNNQRCTFKIQKVENVVYIVSL